MSVECLFAQFEIHRVEIEADDGVVSVGLQSGVVIKVDIRLDELCDGKRFCLADTIFQLVSASEGAVG